ncbi:hypothetical protein [Niabella drilacis]|uniref:Transglutaminase-like superfamily protein n=1 Tax=Niabella drilacis (strain DSM 25811 / CCM 8410 / CCUG 62505 / LMG 26954 / E90) TaxID=1285928 RepID=A0A1G6XWP2_NIADE|nr:hypothetical protein [Niabella drilacis]SDD82093.1 hypothetical protein SAMN04487894_11433 [Niabella drilacis]
MKKVLLIWSFFLLTYTSVHAGNVPKTVQFLFYGDSIQFACNETQLVTIDEHTLSGASILSFYTAIRQKDYSGVLAALKKYETEEGADNWLYYQLVRAVVQQISPKEQNYIRYTLYKWYFMLLSGFDPMLSINGGRLLFYIQSDENIYNIPYRMKQGKQYICLNYHDYGSNIDFEKTPFNEVALPVPQNNRSFSYKVTRLPRFETTDYVTKELKLTIYNQDYDYHIKVNPKIKNLFANYPTVDYSTYFSIPVSNATHASLIPMLKKELRGLSIKNGVDYLMRFTRYAFPFEEDTRQFGQEKRLTPEQTLLYNGSDCEDRVLFFFYLVKELYNRPMIVLVYPQHVTIAVKLEKPVGTSILFNGEQYSVCEPTPQKEDIPMGKLLPQLKNEHYEVAYAYHP